MAFPAEIIVKDHSLLPLRDTLAMNRGTRWLRSFVPFACTLFTFLGDAGRFQPLCMRPRSALAAENLFLRNQRALYQERQVKPRGATSAVRFPLCGLERWSHWQRSLALIAPQTSIR
jgi:hypothetical protein